MHGIWCEDDLMLEVEISVLCPHPDVYSFPIVKACLHVACLSTIAPMLPPH